jgi:mannitol-1-/sugar-/sorbitol-6-phosphatase
MSASPVEIPCQGILFDMDGILISSLEAVERSWTKWAELRGFDPAMARHIAHGRRAVDTLATMCPECDCEVELKLIEDIEVADNEGLTVLPGVCELLAMLPAKRWTVVTSATERLARVRLAAGKIPAPEHLVTADRVTRGKPHPEPFLAGAALLGIAPKDCVVFEDSAAGAIAGRSAGCTVIATTFSHSAGALEAAHYLVEDLAGVRAERRDQGFILRFTPLVAGEPVPAKDRGQKTEYLNSQT